MHVCSGCWVEMDKPAGYYIGWTGTNSTPDYEYVLCAGCQHERFLDFVAKVKRGEMKLGHASEYTRGGHGPTPRNCERAP